MTSFKKRLKERIFNSHFLSEEREQHRYNAMLNGMARQRACDAQKAKDEARRLREEVA